LTGWKADVRLADTLGAFADACKGLYGPLRMVVLKQRKRGPPMYEKLHRLGASGAALEMAARFGRSWKHVAALKAAHSALPVH
jgi:hypothetical protein